MTTAIIKELENRGYKATANKVIKNGVEREGISVFNPASNVSPIIYTEQLQGTLEERVNKVIELYENYKLPSVKVDDIMNGDFFASHLVIALQRLSHEDIVKKPYLEDMEQYLMLAWDDKSIRVKQEHLELAGMDTEQAWNVAMQNTRNNATIRNIVDVLAGQMGMDRDIVEMMMGSSPMWVISNKCNIKGASAILCKDLIADFCKEQGVDKVVFIPSSIHEGIIVPLDESHMSIEQLNAMVNEVNSNEVSPEEQLSDRAYIIEV